MKVQLFIFATIVYLSAAVISVNAQCDTWIGKPTQSDAENAHTIYRQSLKSNELELAFENWQIAYKLAPAADGNRDYHYTDGIEIYKQKLSNTTDEKLKQEYGEIIMRLYDEAISCYKSKSIKVKGDTEEALNDKLGYLYGRKAYDMFYIINTPYAQTIEALDNSIKYAGDKAEYIIMDPYGRIIVWEYKEGRMPKEKAVELYKRLSQISEYNIANNEALSAGYQQAQASMDGIFAEIEKEIFDCDFFKEKLIPEYEENRDDPQVLKRVLATLKSQGCAETDSVIIKLDAEWKLYAKEENERLQAEFEANNPAAAAKAAYDDGKYNEAISKYR
ncbi:MAG TPA: hypothetical protein PJ990_10610, partial [Saprospiraceae bacterium]|nr:hypothetical protein [Saprospiraceae bacterium]